MERSGLDEVNLRRIRKTFMTRCAALAYPQRQMLAEGGTCPRFQLMIQVLEDTWGVRQWEAWLRYLEHTREDLAEMCRGEYPISPYLIRVFSALFGIRVEFLLLGSAPCVDRVGANIDVWPAAGT
jgi:hypothetical protein